MTTEQARQGSGRARRYFDILWNSFERAYGSGPSREVDLSIARQSWRLRFASPSLAEMFRAALAHIESNAVGSVDLTVGLWSESSSGVAIPSPGVNTVVNPTTARLDSYCDESITVILDAYFGLLVAVDVSSSRALYAVRDENAIPGWERAAPLRYLFNSWFAERGIQMVHAACVSRAGRGALLTGRGGSGKSTTALLCLDSGLFDYLGDDYCLARPGKPSEAFSLFNSAKLHPEDLGRFPRLREHFQPAIRIAEGEKPVVFLRDIDARGLASECRLDAIYLPRVSNSSGTTIAPTARGETWHAIAPSTIGQLRGSSPRNVSLIASLSSSVPAFRLDLGSDLIGIPHAIAAHLDSLAHPE